MRKILPYLLLLLAAIVMIVLMSTINAHERANISIMQADIIGLAVVAILLITVGIAMILKRIS